MLGLFALPGYYVHVTPQREEVTCWVHEDY